jgi:pimeloyl-ACP methyl ester carboxylesterase
LKTLGQRFRVVAPDTRGCGLTRHTSGTISMNLLADDTAALIEALELTRPAVYGFSEGGVVATILGIHHPIPSGQL